eukprot:UC4_evm1s1427
MNVEGNNANITLRFDETVSAASVDPKQITLQNEDGTQSLRLTGGACDSADGTTIVIALSRDDLNVLKANENLFTSYYAGSAFENSKNAYIKLDAAVIKDTSDNDAHASDAKPVTTFKTDSMGSVLESFDLDLNTNQLHLHFDEAVDVTRLSASKITLVSSDATTGAVEYSLKGGKASGWEVKEKYSSEVSVDVTLDLTPEDANTVKQFRALAASANTTYIKVSSGLVYDKAVLDSMGKANPSLEAGPMRVDQYTEDKTEPELVSFKLDMNETVMVLRFSETVKGETLDVSRLTLVNVGASDTIQQSRTLSDSTFAKDDSVFIRVYLGDDDSNEIKRLTSLGTEKANSFMTIGAGAILDMNDQPCTQREGVESKDGHEDDEVRPILKEFVLNMNTSAVKCPGGQKNC